MSKFLKKHRYDILICALVLFAGILRFYHYQNRWGLAYDQAHDALLARFAIRNWKLPLVGPFSSAGPFQTGGEWYWFIMLGTLIYPQSVITPWVLLSLLYVMFIIFMIRIAKILVGKRFSLIVGLLSTVSTAQITQSTNLTNQSPLAFCSLAALWFMVQYVQTKKSLALFFEALWVGIAVTIHLQGIALAILLVVTILVTNSRNRKAFLVSVSGLLLPLLPLLIFDLQHGFINSYGLLYYFFVGQRKISFDMLGRRWFTYLGYFWPTEWGYIIGGWRHIGYLTTICLLFSFSYATIRRKLAQVWLIIGLSFFGTVVLLRYTRTPLFSSYLVFLHPFILLLTAWFVWQLWQRKRMIGVIALSFLVLGSMIRTTFEIKDAYNATARQSISWAKALNDLFPNQTYALYDYKFETRDKSVPLSLFLDQNDRVRNDGVKVGIARVRKSFLSQYRVLASDLNYQILDLTSTASGYLPRDGWVRVNPQDIYESTEEWPRLEREKQSYDSSEIQ